MATSSHQRPLPKRTSLKKHMQKKHMAMMMMPMAMLMAMLLMKTTTSAHMMIIARADQ